MVDVIKPGNEIIFMKVGLHAQESFDRIVARKQQEFAETGRIFWGYGGNTCHPTTLVQPFAREVEEQGRRVHLVMSPMDSRHFAEPELAREYSDDGITWAPIPEGIQVRGSRYALILEDLSETDLNLDLRQAIVAVGPSRGRRADEYVRGQVDKGCFRLGDFDYEPAESESLKHIGFFAPVQKPYAVFVR